MPTEKKTATTTEAATPAVKAAPVKKTTNPEARGKAAPTAAATHKAPARKSAAPKPEAKASAARKPAFDENAFRSEIEREAYLIWEGRGHAHGQAHEDWLRAVEIVRARKA